MKILKLCMCFLLFWNILCSSAVASDDYLSNKIGTVLSTDIIAMIDYKPIPSYNINGYTYIMAEELSDYGFDVEWNADKRTLDITRNNCINANLNEDILYAQHVKKNEIGIKIFDVLNTDIQTFLDGKISNSYNVGGQTLIQVDELMQYGDVEYNEHERVIRSNIIVNDKNENPQNGRGYKKTSNHSGMYDFYEYIYVGEFKDSNYDGIGYYTMIYDMRPNRRTIFKAGIWENNNLVNGNNYLFDRQKNEIIHRKLPE